MNKKNIFSNKKNIILNVARFTDQKDHLTLLKGFKNAKHRNKFRLYLIGYGKNIAKIRAFILKNELNNVKIFENKFQLKRYYSESKLFILTSIYEGFPNVLVEAASYRLPIFSTDFKSGSKEILLNGKGGTIFKIRDDHKLSMLIDNFYEDEKNFLKKKNLCKKFK